MAFFGTTLGSGLTAAWIWVAFSYPVSNGTYMVERLGGMDQGTFTRNAGFLCVVVSGAFGFHFDDA